MFVYYTVIFYLLCFKAVFGSDCESKQTCDECIREIECAWCITPETDSSGQLIHCRSKVSDNNWCRDGFESPEMTVEIKQEDAFSNHTDNPVQIRPQRVKLTLRKGEKYDLKFQYKMTENFPVDLYYIMDLSNSMRDYKENLAELGNNLAQAMRNLTTNFRLGFGSFIDKVELPFASTDPVKLKNPCGNPPCAPSYSFKNHLSLTNDSTEFVSRVRAAEVSGNLDSPEGGFDAIMQAIVCKEKIKWRKQARHLLVFSTDAEFHIGGDGRLAGVYEPNPASCYTSESDYLVYDYPSISQVNHVSKDNKINIIFAIVKKSKSFIAASYDKLRTLIENSNFGIIHNAEDDSIIKLVVENYKKISEKIEMTSDAPKEIDVKFASNCTNRGSICSSVHVGQVIDYTATIQPRECPQNRKQIIKIHPKFLDQSLVIELDIVCDCSCSAHNSSSFEEKSEKCSEQGNLKCGECDCFPGRFGKTCQCDSSYSQSENITQCIAGNTGEICSGLGECKCGKCECFPRSNPFEKVYGQFCECNNYSCKKQNGQICSGKGTCNCKVCECYAGFSGEVCECEENTANCIAQGTDKICSDHGQCVCGKCECTMDENKYSGKFCDDCVSCPAKRCEELKNCAVCKIHNTGEYNEEQCLQMCNYTIRSVSKLSDEGNPSIKKCRVADRDNCIIMFEYFFENKTTTVHVLNERICPEPVNIIAWIIGVLITTLIAGIIMLVIWKIFTTIHDRREYAKFEEERHNMRWQTGGNPLYRDAQTTFHNPTFKRSVKSN